MLAVVPLVAQHLARGEVLAEGQDIRDAVFDEQGLGPGAAYVVGVLVLAEVAKLIRNVQVLEVVPILSHPYSVYFLLGW